MDLSTGRSCNPSIVAPAGNLEKLRHAVRFGAHEVYFGGEQFNLRSQSGNFTLEDIAHAAEYCTGYGVRSVFLLNSFVHEDDLPGIKRYLKDISRFPFDAVMVSDPGMLVMLKESGSTAPVHLSTQMSTLNHLAVKFWNDLGVRRIVLGREATLDEVRKIKDHTEAEIEIFVHGALCISYSGRCLLSRYLSGRDANRGACAHPCRWRYSLMEEKRQGSMLEFIEHARGTEILSSKDLCLVMKLGEYLSAGVDAFKIEGRMKSLYYTANTTRIYRHALDTALRGGATENHREFWRRELDLVSHRPYTEDLFNEFDNLGFEAIPYIKKALFLGYRYDGENDSAETTVKVFNPIYAGDTLEAIYPIKDSVVRDHDCTVEVISDDEKNVAMAQPGKLYRIRFDRPIGPHAVFRRIITAAQGDSDAF